MSYAIGALMFEWLVGTYGLEGYIKILNQLSTSSSFNDSLRSSIGLTQAEFYDACADYVLEVFERVQKS